MSTTNSEQTTRVNVNVAKEALEDPKAILTNATKSAIKQHLDAARYTRKARVAGVKVALFDNRERQLIARESNWFAACLDHGALLPADSISAASDWQPHPQRWCPSCKAAAAETPPEAA